MTEQISHGAWLKTQALPQSCPVALPLSQLLSQCATNKTQASQDMLMAVKCVK
jgi:hypothetical protein